MDRRKQLRSLLRQNTNKKRLLPSKLCGYNDKQQLICKICKITIKSVTLWKIHSQSTKHTQTLQHLLKLKNERDAKSQTQTKSKPIKNDNKDNDIKQNKNKKIKPTKDGSGNKDNNKEKEKEKDKKEILMNGLPLNFFDKTMQHKRPKIKQKTINNDDNDDDDDIDDGYSNHLVIVDDNNNNTKKIMDPNVDNMYDMDDTDKALLKLENEMKIEHDKNEEELLKFVAEYDKKLENEETMETQFKINNLQQYRMQFETFKNNKNNKKRLLDNDDNTMPPKKKRKLNVITSATVTSTNDNDQNGSGSDSDFDANDIFDLQDWRTQQL